MREPLAREVLETLDRLWQRADHVDVRRGEGGVVLSAGGEERQVATSPDEALATLGRVIPQPKKHLSIEGRRVELPDLYIGIECVLKDGDEPAVLQLFYPRSAEDTPHLFEQGLPQRPIDLPWHVDVLAKIPKDPNFLPHLADHLLLALMTQLSSQELRTPWVLEVLERGETGAAAEWLKRAYPGRIVLSTDPAAQTARAEGAEVVEPSALPTPVRALLERGKKKRKDAVHALTPAEERGLSFLKQLAKLILGKPIAILTVRRPPEHGRVDDATFDRKKGELRINLEGHADLSRPLSPVTLGIFFHELAHTETHEHDAHFIEALERVSGTGAAILAKQGHELADRFRVPFN